MKNKITLLATFFSLGCLAVKATTFNVTISGMTYSPAITNCTVGDTVLISANGNHPLVEVDSTTWAAGGNTPRSGGWATTTSTHTYVATAPGTVWFVCQNHAGTGMKGQINVSIGTGINSAPQLDFIIFPNPISNGKFNVQLDGSVTSESSIHIFNTNGQLMFESVITPGGSEFQSGLSSGIFFLELRNGIRILGVRKILVD